MNPETLMRRIARQWFTAHPSSVVMFHWRQDEINMDMMRSPRTAKVIGQRVVFAPHHSTLYLDGLTSADVSTGNLILEFGRGRAVEYRAV